MAHVQFDSSFKLFRPEHIDFINFCLWSINKLERKPALKGLSCKFTKEESASLGVAGTYYEAGAEFAWNGQRLARFRYRKVDSIPGSHIDAYDHDGSLAKTIPFASFLTPAALKGNIDEECIYDWLLSQVQKIASLNIVKNQIIVARITEIATLHIDVLPHYK